MKHYLVGLLLALFALATPAAAQTFPPLTGRVVDQAHLLTPAQVADLSSKSQALETQTGRQFVIATVNEFMMASAVNGAWKFLHWAMAVLFILGAIASFAHPYDTFYSLASILGFLLLFMGTLEIVRSVSSRADNPVWGLGLAVGILEILLAIWVSQRLFPARAELILIWVGFMAIFRGISQIAVSFGVRRLRREVAPA